MYTGIHMCFIYVYIHIYIEREKYIYIYIYYIHTFVYEESERQREREKVTYVAIAIACNPHNKSCPGGLSQCTLSTAQAAQGFSQRILQPTVSRGSPYTSDDPSSSSIPWRPSRTPHRNGPWSCQGRRLLGGSWWSVGRT